MRCFNHSDREAVGTCIECGNFVCEGCNVKIDGKNYCKKCVTEKMVNTNGSASNNSNGGKKDWLTTLLLCLFLGGIGGHRFYVGKTGTAIAQLLTGGGCGIWVLIDLINIIAGNFKDNNGNELYKR